MKKYRGCFVRKWYYIFQIEKKNKVVFFTKKWCFFWGTGNIAGAGQKLFRHFRRDKKINFNFESLFKIEMIVIIISSKWEIFCLYEPKQWISFFGIKNIKKIVYRLSHILWRRGGGITRIGDERGRIWVFSGGSPVFAVDTPGKFQYNINVFLSAKRAFAFE